MRRMFSLIILFVLVASIVQIRPVAAALTISPDTLPMAFVGSYYTAELRTDSKYPDYVKWEMVTGGLPPGLGFQAPIPVGSPANIAGTPTSEGDYGFTARATEQVPDGSYAEKTYTLQVRTTTTPPSQTPMEFTCTAKPTKIILDPTEIALGRVASVLASFTVSVRKTGGDLTEYVTITMSWFAVEPASTFTVIPDVTGGQPPIDKTIQVYLRNVERWREVQGTTETLLITCRTPEREQTLNVQVEVVPARIAVDLQLVSVMPITQRGPDLVKNKEAQFAFTYTKSGTGLEPDGSINAWVEVRLPKSQWDFTYHGGIYSATFESRDEGGFYIIRGQFSFRQTTIPPSPLELMFFPTDEGFFYPKPRTNVASLTMTIDPDNEIAEQNEDNNQILASWPVPYEASKLNLAWVYYRPEGLPWGVPPGKEGPSAFPRVARLYLPAIFPIKDLDVHPLLGDGINAWTAPTSYLWSNKARLIKEADQMAEVGAESGYHRVVAILPEGDLGTLLERPGVLGVVMPGTWWLGSESYKVAYVNLNEATGGGTKYIPTVAHELSHTFGFPDIYDGCKKSPRVDYRWIYFDPVYGGIVQVGDPGYDIMACGSSPQQWSDHSYQKVHDQLKTFGDPAEGLLISMIAYKNGTVDARPFQKLVDHPFPFPVAEGTGPYNLLLLGKDSGVIRSYPWNVDFSMLVDPGGKEPADSAPFVTVVEYFDDLGAVELRDANGNVLMRREVSAHRPELTVIDPAPGKILGRGLTYSFQWNCIDADGGDIWYSVLMRKSDQETWSNLAHYVKEKTLKFTVPGDAELGDYYLKFIATDGINTDMKIVSVSISAAAPTTATPPQTARTTTSSRSTTSPPGQGGFPDLTLLIIGILAVFVIIFAALALRTRKTGPSAPISVQPTPPAAAEKPGPLSLYCIDCGTENPSTNEFCGKCGQKLLREKL